MPEEAEALLPLAAECGLTPEDARARMRMIAGALSGWKECARSNGIREREVTMLAESIEPWLEAVTRAADAT